MNFLFFICGGLLGALIIYLFCRKHLKVTAQLNEQIIQENEIAQKELLTSEGLLKDVRQTISLEENNLSNLKQQQDLINENFDKITEQAQQMAKTLYQKQVKAFDDKLVVFKQKEYESYQNEIDIYKKEYLKMLHDCSVQISTFLIEKQTQIDKLVEEIANYQKITDAIVEANKRAAAQIEKENFYKLQLLEEDLDEIAQLRNVGKNLRNAEPLNKVIWKIYYEKPYTDLIGRVVGSGVHCGIYKITDTATGMCYVGQAVDIAARWKQHIKRGLGAEAPTKNKLYPAMKKIGVENFSFEIIEECDRSKLDKQEDYWQEFYHAKDFGYSIK